MKLNALPTKIKTLILFNFKELEDWLGEVYLNNFQNEATRIYSIVLGKAAREEFDKGKNSFILYFI